MGMAQVLIAVGMTIALRVRSTRGCTTMKSDKRIACFVWPLLLSAACSDSDGSGAAGNTAGSGGEVTSTVGGAGPGGAGTGGAPTGGSGGSHVVMCGDGVREDPEVCEGTDYGAASCATEGFSDGTLQCNADCTLDTSGCRLCGNGVIEPGEDCDGEALGIKCVDIPGFTDGEIACTEACKHDTSLCCTMLELNCNETLADGCEVDKLTDPLNCGSCDHVCSGTCTNGLCDPILLVGEQGSSLVVQGAYLYYINSGSIKRVPIAGGLPETLVTGEMATSLALDATHVYFTVSGSSTGTVKKVPLAGGTVTQLVPSILYSPGGIAVTATNAYFIEGGGGYLSYVPLSGGSQSNLYTSGPNGSGTVAIVGNTAVWSNLVSKQIRSVPLGGGASTVLATGVTWVHHVAVDSANAYFLQERSAVFDGGVYSVPLAGGAVTELATTIDPYYASDLAIDSTHIYWGEGNGAGAVRWAQKDGSNPQSFVTSWPVVDIAVDATNIYWSTQLEIQMYPK